MGLRNWLFKAIYPLPQKGEDLLNHKQQFIEEYTSSYLFFNELKDNFIPERLLANANYIKRRNDKYQKKRFLAYKEWQKIVFRKKILAFKKRRKIILFAKQMIKKINEKADYIQKETERERLYREKYSNPENSTICGSKGLRDWEARKRFLAHKKWHDLQRQR